VKVSAVLLRAVSERARRHDRPLNLPYPQLMPVLEAWGTDVQRLMHEQPGNPFLRYVPSVNRAVARSRASTARSPRLTVVEALGSYAAAHDGKLPTGVGDVTETPVPQNPATGCRSITASPTTRRIIRCGSGSPAALHGSRAKMTRTGPASSIAISVARVILSAARTRAQSKDLAANVSEPLPDRSSTTARPDPSTAAEYRLRSG